MFFVRRFRPSTRWGVAVASRFWADPLAIFELTAQVLAAIGRERAFVLGLMASQRNMGLRLAAIGGALPDLTWLYFAQFPVYLSPLLFTPLARRLKADAVKNSRAIEHPT